MVPNLVFNTYIKKLKFKEELMMKKKTKLIIVFMVLMVSIMFYGCSKETKGQNSGTSSAVEGPIRIGYIGPLTGDSAPWGIAQSNVLKMLSEEINAEGGVLGRQLEFFCYDNRGDNLETVNAAKRLIQQDKVSAIIGTESSGTSVAMANVCEENKIPQLSFGTNQNVIVKDDGKVRPYTFRMLLTSEQLGGIMASYAYNELNTKTVGTLYELGSDYSIGVKEAFEAKFIELGGTITTSEAYKTGEVDFRAQLSKIKESKPEAIFLPALYKQIGLAANQARQLGIECRFLGTDSWAMADVLTLGGDSIEDTYFTSVLDLDDPLLDELKGKYMDKYNEHLEDMAYDGFAAHDAFKVLVDAIIRAGNSDSVAIRDALEKTKDVQGCAFKISIDPDTHNPNTQAYIMKVEDGKFNFVTKY